MSCNWTNRTTVSAEIAADNPSARNVGACAKSQKTQAVIGPDNLSAFSGQLSGSHRPDKIPPPFRGGLSGCPPEGFIDLRQFQQLSALRDDLPLYQSQFDVIWDGLRARHPDAFGREEQ